MSDIKAISFDERQCGKHLAETKKRFVWTFEINGKNYTLELINSTLSGKKTVLLNMEQIYSEKNLLNIDFDFTHMIQGHSFRISRVEDMINKFQLRIDNRTFDEIRLGIHKKSNNTNSTSFAKKQHDPFADFGNIVSNDKSTSNNNDFGDFDFDSFSKPSTQNTQKIQQISTSQPKNAAQLLDFDEGKKENSIPVNDFQTNAFQTNNAGFSDFANSFKQNEFNLLDQNEFSTNAYANRNHYMDLQTSQTTSDKYFGDDVPPPVQENKQKAFWQAFDDQKKKASLAFKKAYNDTAIKVNETKKAVKSYVEDLI